MASPTYQQGTIGNVLNAVALAPGKNVAALVDLSTVVSGAIDATVETGATAPTAATTFALRRVKAARASLPNTTLSAAVPTPTGSAALSWSAVAGATGYRIYRATTSGGESSSPAFVATTTGTTYTDTGLAVSAGAVPATDTATIAAPALTVGTLGTTGGTFAAAETYYYEITALTASGETTPSAEVSAAVGATTDTVPLSWPAVAGATGYRIYRATTSGGETGPTSLLTAIGSGSTTSYTDTGTATTTGSIPATNTATIPPPTAPSATAEATGGSLASGVYFYKVTATNASGETTGSAEFSATIPATINVASAAGITLGQQIALIGATNKQGEVVTVSAISGTTLTLSAPTTYAYALGDLVFLTEQTASGGSIAPGSAWSANSPYGTSLTPYAAYIWILLATNTDGTATTTVTATLDTNPSIQ